jgi:hypothetical protein
VLQRSGAKRVIVALSGGKDSLCVLDLCVKHFGPHNVQAYRMSMVPGLEFELAPVRRAIFRYGIPFHEMPHWAATEMKRKGILCDGPDDEMPRLSQAIIEEAVRERTGWADAPVAHGTRVSESLNRIAQLRKHGVMGVERTKTSWRVFPIYEWSSPDVFSYMRVNRIPVPAKLDRNHSMSLSFEGRTLSIIRERYPEDWARIQEAFPRVETVIEKWRLFGEGVERTQALPLPEVRGRAHAPPRAEGRAVQPARDHRGRSA